MKGNFARPPTLKKGDFYDKNSQKYEIYVGSDYETCGSELGIDADFFLCRYYMWEDVNKAREYHVCCKKKLRNVFFLI